MEPNTKLMSELVSINDAEDILTYDGVRITGALLHVFARPTPEGQWFRIIKLENGTATVEVRRDLIINKEYRP
jgi:hypothetical protein